MNYTLAYRPAEKNWNGKFHKVKVTCARKDVQVVAEDGYMADPPTDQTDALVKAVAWSGSDIPEIALRATATRGNAANTVRLQARIGIPGLFIVPQADHFTGELAVVFVGLTGKDPIPLTKSKILTLNLSAAEWDAAKDGIAMGEELAVPESVRQVRVIVVDRWAGRVGSLTVPKIW